MSNQEEQVNLSGVVVEAGGYKVHKEEESFRSDGDNKLPTDESKPITQVELSIEDQARLQGWTPQEEFRGDKAKWKDAKRFIEDGILYKKYDSLHKDNLKLKDSFRSLVENQSKIYEMSYRQALADIEAAKQKVKGYGEAGYEQYDQLNKAEADLKASYKPPELPRFEDDQVKEPDTSAIKQTTAWQKFVVLAPWAEKTDSDSMFLRNKAKEYGMNMPEPKTEQELDNQLGQIYTYISKEYGSVLNKTKPKMNVMPVDSYTTKTKKVDEGEYYGNLSIAEQGAIEYLKRSNQAKMIPEFLKTIKK